MPELCRFAGMIIYMYFEDFGRHNKPHVHIKYAEYEAVMSLEGEILEGNIPSKQRRMVSGWLAFHEEEAYAAWNKAVRHEHFDKIGTEYNDRGECLREETIYGNGLSYPLACAVESLGNMQLMVSFENGEKRIYDVSTLNGPVFEILKDKKVFDTVTLVNGTVGWCDGTVDIAPENLYFDSITYEG